MRKSHVEETPSMLVCSGKDLEFGCVVLCCVV